MEESTLSEEPQARKADKSRWGYVAHLAGNVLLGLSLGLLAYYGVTNLVALRGQADLEDALAGLGPIAEASPPVDAVQDPWADWEDEDLAYWEALETGGIFGRLVISELDMDVVVVKGTERQDLKRGPGWIVETDTPGPTGNCGISGHRTTYGAPFRRIDRLQVGDAIQFYSPFRRYSYEVTEQLAVRPWETSVVASTAEPMLTMTACHPPYSAAYRLIVQSRLTGVERLRGFPPGFEE